MDVVLGPQPQPLNGSLHRPTSSATLGQLKLLQGKRPTESVVKKAVCLLRLLPLDMTEEEESMVLVPELTFRMQPLSAVYYNDIGERAHLFESDEVYIAHSSIDEGLAKSLGMKRLGLKTAGWQNTDEDMGEQLLTTIRNKLREYTENQVITEFVANAADAGATKFGILIDNHRSPDKKILSQDMAAFQTCPSLIIHNDAMFTDADFRGIIKTGIGGKAERSDTIGQFGFGALTMFHFTEVIIGLFFITLHI